MSSPQGRGKRAGDSPSPQKAKKNDTGFPIDLGDYQTVTTLDPWACGKTLQGKEKKAIEANVELCRNAIVTFTACGAASGYGGHTGGAFDTVPEVCILDAFFASRPDKFVPVLYDEAGHRVATQYLFSAIKGHIAPSKLINYRKGHEGLPGHPEGPHVTPGVQFASGRLGHMWPWCNGVAMAHPDKVVICLGSDGSQMEGNDAEAARIAVSQKLNVKLIIDDNDVTISGKPSVYQPGFSVAQTLRGHGMTVLEVKGDDTAAIFSAVQAAVVCSGPVAVCIHREMCPGIQGLEGTPKGHDVIAVQLANDYLKARKLDACIETIAKVGKTKDPHTYTGVGEYISLRQTCGETMAKILGKMDKADREARVKFVDSDLEGSTAINKVRQQFPECYVSSGIMERGNFAAAAGFAHEDGKVAVFATFCAFLEMVISEIFMARLNTTNVLCYFTHSGVDDMADNTCHYGLNLFFCDNGLAEHGACPLYFPGEPTQAAKVTEKIFFDKGMKFLFSLRSKCPVLINPATGKPYYGPDYVFQPGRDEELIPGTLGYVVSFADALYRAHDAVLRLRQQGLDVGLINKVHLNACDDQMTKKVGATKFCLVSEPINRKTGLGIHYGYNLFRLGARCKYDHIGVHKEGAGGLWEHAYHHGYDSESVQKAVRNLIK